MAEPDAETVVKMIGPPDAFAKKMRRSYPMFFAPSAICAAAATGFAVRHVWVYVAAFAASALIYFPVSLGQYRRSRRIIEKSIAEYAQWYPRQQDSTKG